MSTALAEISSRLPLLTAQEKEWLLQQLTAQTSRQEWEEALKRDIDAMAADPDIRRELQQIDQEFRVTEMDGLGSEA
jgi:hypothetical protein